MIEIRAERCTGCGACVEACPNGALYLVNGKAAVDNELCRGCEPNAGPCITACPNGAIVLSEATVETKDAAGVPAPRPEPEVIRLKTSAPPEPLRSKVLQLLGTGLIWAGREVVPRLAEALLDRLERQPQEAQTPIIAREESPSQQRPGPGSGRRRRRRWKGGRSETD